jgi:hypothetical protein
MELLLGALTAVLIEAGKKVVDKLGYKIASFAVLGSAFALSVVFSVLTIKGIITSQMISSVGLVWASSIATYEIVIKNLMPIYSKIFSAGEKQK